MRAKLFIRNVLDVKKRGNMPTVSTIIILTPILTAPDRKSTTFQSMTGANGRDHQD